jgi:hypothetical protein
MRKPKSDSKRKLPKQQNEAAKLLLTNEAQEKPVQKKQPESQRKSLSSKGRTRKECAHKADNIPKGVRDFLGEALHLFRRDDCGFVLSQGRPARKR